MKPLDVANTGVSDLAALEIGLELSSLDISGTAVTELAPLAKLPLMPLSEPADQND